MQPAVKVPSVETGPVDPLIPSDGAPLRMSGSSDVCEGWGPPPNPFCMDPIFDNFLILRNLIWLSCIRTLDILMPKFCQSICWPRKLHKHIVEAAKDFVCDACVESTGRRHQRPAKLHTPRDFNDCVGVDGFFWKGHLGFQAHALHCIDEASLFHLGKRIPTRNPDQIIHSWNDFWTLWAGPPKNFFCLSLWRVSFSDV